MKIEKLKKKKSPNFWEKILSWMLPIRTIWFPISYTINKYQLVFNYLDKKLCVVARTYIALVDFLETNPHSNPVPPKKLSVSCFQLPNARIIGTLRLRVLSFLGLPQLP